MDICPNRPLKNAQLPCFAHPAPLLGQPPMVVACKPRGCEEIRCFVHSGQGQGPARELNVHCIPGAFASLASGSFLTACAKKLFQHFANVDIQE